MNQHRPHVGWRGIVLALPLLCSPAWAESPPSLKILFLGDRGHHQPAERFRQLQPVLAKRNIALTYSEQVDSLHPDTLNCYDGLLLYANTTDIKPEQEKALLDYVAQGKGFIPVHCASYCFLNSPKFIELVGAQFRSHGTGVFRTTMASVEHPILKGYRGFESWDETYVHHKHNESNRTVLEYRVDRDIKEPWTWVRTQGKGRVFYTAWGHDARTWGNPGFHNLLERGIRWACGQDPTLAATFADRPDMTPLRKDVQPFKYVEANVPFYPPSDRWGVVGEPLKQMQLPLEPTEAQKHYVTPVGFSLQLFASDPQIGKPLAMNWDEQGRLWLAETVDYPNELQPAGKGRDRIRVCEDTDGDGRADKFTVFADKLSIPTSLTFYNGGVIVHQAPHTLYLKDTDGDGVADERKILFTGWSTGDTHAGPSNLRWGLDNWLWGMVGYAGYEGTVGGERHSFRQGFFRFKPDGSRMEFLRNTNNNSWGVGFSEEGLVFGSTANGNPSVYMPIPNRYYEKVRGASSSVLGSIAENSRFYPVTERVRQVDHHGRFTSAAGHALYTARTYPREYWNRTAFVSDPTGHLTATFVLQAQGSDFQSKNSWNLVASDDEWAAPIMAEVGPDGHVWVLDWYNYIVQHNPTPVGFKTGKGNAYETDLRDKKHARIYRVVYDKAAKTPRFTLKDATPEKLVATLGHDNQFWRLHAQRLLVERGQHDVVLALAQLFANSKMDELGLNVRAMHALATLDGLGAVDSVLANVAKALEHPSAGVRRMAVTVLPRHVGGLKALLASGVLTDADAQVRLASLLALSEMPVEDNAGKAAARSAQQAENLDDRWLPDALIAAAARHDLAFLQAMSTIKKADPRTLTVVHAVAEHYARGAPVDSVGKLVGALASAEPAVAETVVTGLARGWPRGKLPVLSDATERALAQLLTQLPASGKGQLVRLATTWGSKGLEKYSAEIVQSLLAEVSNSKRSEEERLTAVRQLMELQPNEADVVTQLLRTLTPQTPPALATGLIEALGVSQLEGLGKLFVKQLDTLTPAARTAALRLLLRRPAWTEALMAAVENRQVLLTELSLDQKQSLAAHPDRKLAERARKLLAQGGGLPSADRQKVLERLMPIVKKSGDPVRGKVAYMAQCAKCHLHGGEGVNIGPDLTGMAVHPKDELLTHILDPSRSVEGNFRLYNVTTGDGRVFTGLLASETKTSIELVDVDAKKHVLLRENIEEIVASTKSLMPEGFENQLKPDELSDLLEFLTQRGKYLPLPLDKAATIVSTQGMFFDKDGTTERMIFPDWTPKQFEGIPFRLVDPQGTRVPNAIMLYGPQGKIAPTMPRSVSLPCNTPVKTIHMLSGVGGWNYPASARGSVSMIVRLHYADGKTEDHRLINGEHFADYIRRIEVPRSKFAFALRDQQLRYLTVTPERAESVVRIELVKGRDASAPIVMAVTVEPR